jgi:hypothetical protein
MNDAQTFVLGSSWAVIDGLYTRVADIPGVGPDGFILGVNNAHLIVGSTSGDDLFLVSGGVRTALDDAVTEIHAPAGIVPELAAMDFVDIGNDGSVLLRQDNATVWVLRGGVLSYAWTGLAYDANASGAVVGALQDPGSTTTRGVVRWADGTVQVLDGLSTARFINTLNHIVGFAPAGAVATPMMWVDGHLTNLGKPGSTVHGLSDAGRVLLKRYEPNRFGTIVEIPYVVDTADGVQNLASLVIGGGFSPFFGDLRMFADGTIVPEHGAVLRPIADVVAYTARSNGSFSIATTDAGAFVVFTTWYGEVAVMTKGSGGWTVTDSQELRASLGLTQTDPLDILDIHSFDERAFIVGTGRVLRTGVQGLGSLFPVVVGQPIVGSSSMFVSQDQRDHLAGATADGDLVLLYQIESGNSEWAVANLADLLEQNGQSPVSVAESLTSFAMPWGAMNIAYLDASGDVQVVWWAPGLPAWRIDNLSEMAGAPPLHGTLVSYVTPWNGQNIVGTDADGNLVALWWTPGMGAWRSDRLVDGTPAQLDENSITAYVTPWGGLNIAGLDKSTGKLTAYWWTPGMPAWVVQAFEIQNAPVDLQLKGRLKSAVAEDGRLFVTGVTQDNHIVNIWFGTETGFQWEFEDVTASV